MSAKTSPQRQAAFFAALRATGNQTIAAERAKVSRSWVQLHRSTDPAFDADCRSAIAEAKAALRAGPSPQPVGAAAQSPGQGQGPPRPPAGRGANKPPSGWGYLDGEELVVRGTNGRRVQVARARLRQWTPRVEERFLSLLEQSCNLRLALKAVGLSASSLHLHRKRWPAFDERCERAIAIGYERIDRGLTAEAIRLLDPEVAAGAPPPEARAIAPMSVDDAIRLVRLHERRAWEAARGVGPGGRVRGRRQRG